MDKRSFKVAVVGMLKAPLLALALAASLFSFQAGYEHTRDSSTTDFCRTTLQAQRSR